MSYKVGDEVKYRVIDEECRQRGYGIVYETGTSKIKSLIYHLANRLQVSDSEILEKTDATVKYKTLDMESYSRGYGICYETGTSTIQSVHYRLENGYTIIAENILPS